MRIGLVVDATCDLPQDFLQKHRIPVLPIRIRLGDHSLVDRRVPQATQAFYSELLPKAGPADRSEPLQVMEMQEWFLEELVTRYDHVICLTISSRRSPIFEHATQASFGLLQRYRDRRAAAGVAGHFAMRVVDGGNIFAGTAVLAAEAMRLIGDGAHPNAVRTRLEQLSGQVCTFLLPDDLGHLRQRGFQKGERSGLLDRLRGAALGLGSLLDVKPVISVLQGEDKPVALAPSFDKAAEKLLVHARSQVMAGELLAPQLCMSFAGELSQVRDLPGFAELEAACVERGVTLHLAMLSPTGAINLGRGALSLAYAAPTAAFS
ncbi:DegV family protein [Metapseudomonas lalkuanensis]|uniref:DegV family protein n=1 Tax=Metapseudomonas lalkuanensis TaxID=2604832 RepID=A0A5J6QPZ8_9GAMM|nr:DegV family protein [Pseudomonas lalkuanensis]QEY64788.1 DegV family protein [Pseudomonas lalkuanensis]UCO97342.1 DegV family protein [Pseudomonas lalkuanensis]